MENVLDLLAKPVNEREPVVALDERPVQLLDSTRPGTPMAPGRIARRDYEYVRNGTANVFCIVAPKIRRAPDPRHPDRRFSVAMRRVRWTTSSERREVLGGLRRERHLHHSRKPSRCQRRSVSGLTSPRASRPEFPSEVARASTVVLTRKVLAMWDRLRDVPAARKGFILLALTIAWEAYARVLKNALLLPSFGATVEALWDGIAHGGLLERAGVSLKLLLIGYALAIAIAAALTAIAMSGRIGADLLETCTAMFNPLPAIALLPLALIWFGLSDASIVFVLIHAVLWPLALSARSGFKAVPNVLRMVGRNYGLTGCIYLVKILVPAAFPSILTGLKIGWAFAWRTLIAAELVFGVSSGSGGLGWFIYENKNRLEIPSVFAGLLTVIVIGLIVENLVFGVIEVKTVRKWRMQS